MAENTTETKSRAKPCNMPELVLSMEKTRLISWTIMCVCAFLIAFMVLVYDLYAKRAQLQDSAAPSETWSRHTC